MNSLMNEMIALTAVAGSVVKAKALATKYLSESEKYQCLPENNKLTFATTTAKEALEDLKMLKKDFEKRVQSCYTEQGIVMMSTIVDFWRTEANF